MNSSFFIALANHIWQTTLFVAAIWLVTLALRRNRAAVRHRLWLIASVKFLLPFSLLTMLGNSLTWETAPQAPAFVETMNRPFALPMSTTTQMTSPSTLVAPAFQNDRIPVVFFSVWACGLAANLIWSFIGWARLRRALRQATPLSLDFPLRVMASSERLEPGVFGIFKPVLLIPAGIQERLSGEQLQSVLAHELCHVHRHDNLTAAIHMVVEALFWFHPFVWWIRARLLEEQERACDEHVLSLGSDPKIYAESILKICEFYVTSPLICVSGITGASLKQRIGEIMNFRAKPRLSRSRKLFVTSTLLLCFSVPFTVGIFHSQDNTTVPTSNVRFDAISIRSITAGQAADQQLDVGPRGGFHCRGTDGELFGDGRFEWPLGRCTGVAWGEELIRLAHYTPQFNPRAFSRLIIENIPKEFDIPTGADSAMYQIQAIAPDPSRVTKADLQLMLQSLLRDRFKLKIRKGTRDIDGFNLTVANGGIKFKKSAADRESCSPILPQDGKPFALDGASRSIMIKCSASMPRLLGSLDSLLALSHERKPTEDKTNLLGLYDITLLLDMIAPLGGGRGEGPGQPAQFDPPLPKALEQQLGLRLEPAKVPFDYIVVDHIERPSEN